MKITVFSTKAYDRDFLEAEASRHALTFVETGLDRTTTALAAGAEAVCVFVNDALDAPVIEALAAMGVKLILLRCAGYNNVDLRAAQKNGIAVARVPAYSPYAVAEHTVAMILALNRKLYRAYNRVREGNFALDGLLGFDLHGKTVGIVGTGQIGTVLAHIMLGFGCRVLANDLFENKALVAAGVRYEPLDTLLAESHIVSLHCPLTPDTHHMIDDDAVKLLRRGAMLINTSRGALVDTRAVIAALKSEKIGALGLDVYEEEAHLFFENLSNKVIRDDVFARLLTFPNVLITGHQAFFTHEALTAIAQTTLANADDFEATGAPRFPVHA
ncbi:2-hydroxyacid dehydrogenase [Acuticoccus kandeliae]|uniref:2-hydroxyacid dehydrogenase n=1 Tax=Acuticoccus kandeliae TaxID=2073160 RepID=UPI000D3EA66D|nr:2-hydroxyacid dehydrogenase [Acuticoccus kandeliae]